MSPVRSASRRAPRLPRRTDLPPLNGSVSRRVSTDSGSLHQILGHCTGRLIARHEIDPGAARYQTGSFVLKLPSCILRRDGHLRTLSPLVSNGRLTSDSGSMILTVRTNDRVLSPSNLDCDRSAGSGREAQRPASHGRQFRFTFNDRPSVRLARQSACSQELKWGIGTCTRHNNPHIRFRTALNFSR